MLIMGCDFHPSGQQVFGVDSETGEVLHDRWLDHSGEEVDKFYCALPSGTQVGVESIGNAYCESLDQAVDQAAQAHAGARLLMSHPGIGSVISLGYVLTLGQVERFAGSRQVVSYVGLNPTENSSGASRWLGGISKQGSTFLRFLLIQGAQSAVKGDAELQRQYLRLAIKKNKSIAKVMVARKLAVRMFWMPKTQTKYPEVVRMQGSSSHSVGENPRGLV